MTNILIGSRALTYWEPSLIVKPETDWDVISKEPIPGTEWHQESILNNSQLAGLCTDEAIFRYQNEWGILAGLDVLAAIKRSHLHRELGFDKHITMYHKYLKPHLDCSRPEVVEFYKERQKLTFKEFPQVTPSLKQSVEDFFDDAVTKVYDHDYLHELFAFEDKPMYTKMQRDSTQAWCEKDLWDTFTYQQKLHCVAEEAYVIATERFMVPRDWNYASKLAYFTAVKKICTTLTSGWFRDFAIDNYPEIIAQYSEQKFKAVKFILKGE